jgi:hypothetical protein
MATGTLIKHGTERGYKAEMTLGNACDRCRAAHRVFQRQYSKASKAQGIKYKSDMVIDHLDQNRSTVGQNRPTPTVDRNVTADDRQDSSVAPPPDPSAQDRSEPSLGDRLASRIRDLTIGNGTESPEYVTENDTGYVHEIDDVDQPGPEWEPVDDVDFVINAKALAAIQENLGTYLSIVGMTAEMIDPYCGGAIAANFDNMVQKWSKVIAHYPKAAQLFLDGTGGIIFTWIGALQATWPFLYAVYQHHLARTITIGPDGRVYRRGEQPNPSNNGQVPDPLQPQFQYSAT